jgi:hypothetical protein
MDALHAAQAVLFLVAMNHLATRQFFWFYGYPKPQAEAWARI